MKLEKRELKNPKNEVCVHTYCLLERGLWARFVCVMPLIDCVLSRIIIDGGLIYWGIELWIEVSEFWDMKDKIDSW